MKSVFSSYAEARIYLFKDRVNLTLAMIPVGIGLSLYLLLGKWVFGTLIPYGQDWVSSYFSSHTFGSITYWILVTLMSVVMYLLVSWTLVLIVSLIACPFNDLISKRVEKQLKGEELGGLSEGFKEASIKLLKTLLNEIKKVAIILLFTILAFFLNLIPVLVPLGMLITSILFAIQFVDYSWSRHDLYSKECFIDARKNWIPYSLSGLGFLFIVTIPIVNLLLPAYATSYYTVLWNRLEEKKRLSVPGETGE